MAAVRLPVPSPGDVSYAVARVRIAPGFRLSSPAGLGGQQSIFASHVGGLAIRAGSSSWRGLRANTHVYVVVSMVPGGGRSLRDVGFFILRRKTRGGPAGASVAFTIANARAQVGSFWVHGVDQRGYAGVFAVRNILSTALANWSRYITALQLAHAIAAAAHPLVLSAAPTASATAVRARLPGPWTGGQRPDATVIAMYHLLVGSIGNPSSYALVKKDPLVADFISTELGNPSLAARWRAVVAQVPLKVPDKYAAAAQEEKAFSHVVAPKITHARVAILDGVNSSDELVGDGGAISTPMSLTVAISGSGTVTELNPGPGTVTCPLGSGAFCKWFPDHYLRIIDLKATPAAGSTFSYWEGAGCLGTPLLPANYCELWMSSKTVLIANFVHTASFPLQVSTVSEEAGQTGTVTSNPAGINCGPSCSASFASGSSVTLSAAPAYASYFDRWTGCDSVAGRNCTVTVNSARNVQAYFGYP